VEKGVTYNGSCFCGAVRFTVGGELVALGYREQKPRNRTREQRLASVSQVRRLPAAKNMRRQGWPPRTRLTEGDSHVDHCSPFHLPPPGRFG
jgi:hypothetical protein